VERDEALNIFRSTGGFLEGHFQLTSGLHSPQYFQCAKVLQYPHYAEVLCEEIAGHFGDSDLDVVIAPAIGGIVVGQEVGRQLGRRTIFAEREGDHMALRRGFELMPGERVLVVEDVVTTGGSVREVMDIVRQADCDVVGLGMIVDRSGGTAKFDVDVFSVFQMDVVTYQPDACPLCKKGVPLEKPGSRRII
jgi:orotate phosphoribosyltransferase